MAFMQLKKTLIEWAHADVTEDCKANIIYGLPGVGKSSLAKVLARCLSYTGTPVYILCLDRVINSKKFTSNLVEVMNQLVFHDCFVIIDSLIAPHVEWAMIDLLLRDDNLKHPVIMFTSGHYMPHRILNDEDIDLSEEVDFIKTHAFDIQLTLEDIAAYFDNLGLVKENQESAAKLYQKKIYSTCRSVRFLVEAARHFRTEVANWDEDYLYFAVMKLSAGVFTSDSNKDRVVRNVLRCAWFIEDESKKSCDNHNSGDTNIADYGIEPFFVQH